MNNPNRISLMRLKGLIKKEFLQVFRDPSSIAIAFLLPLILLLVFGYGISLNPENIPIAIVVENPNADTASLMASFSHSKYFEPVVLTNIIIARRQLINHDVQAVLFMRNNFFEDSSSKNQLQLILNGVESNYARTIRGYVEGVISNWAEQQAVQGKIRPIPGVRIEHRIWYNPAVRSRNFLVPGLIAIIMTLIGALLTALIVAREWERGTMEALMATPVKVTEILLGKTLPYLILGIGGLGLSVAMAVFLFDVPLRGSFLLLLGSSTLFLITALGIGLFISTITKNQFVASQIAILVTFLPAFLLSGFIFDITSMPQAVQFITRIIPARYFVSILQTVFLAGNVKQLILVNSLALAIMSVIMLGLTRMITHKKLD